MRLLEESRLDDQSGSTDARQGSSGQDQQTAVDRERGR